MPEPILPHRKDDALLADIAAARAEADQLHVWWLGQSGFLIQWAGRHLLFDPYLTDSLTRKYAATDKPHIRMTECPLNPAEITNADLILCSHKHSDHLDPGTVPAMMSASPNASVVLPRSLIEHAAAMGVPRGRMFGTDAGARVQGFVHEIGRAHV